MRKYVRNAKFVIGMTILFLFLLFGLFPHLFTKYGPFDVDVWHGWDLSIPPFPPSRMHWLGTDDYGRDTYTQLLYGIGPTLRDATILVLCTLSCSGVISVLTTLYQSKTLQFIFDTLTRAMTLIPPVILAILVLEIPPVYFSVHSAWWYYGVIGVLETARFVRIFEGDLRIVMEKPFMEGARTVGNSNFRLFRVHMLRWLWPFVVEYIPAQYARILTVIGELAYFGLFSNVKLIQGQDAIHVETTELDWSAMIATGGHNWFSVPGVVFFTTLSFCMLIFTFRLISAGMQEASTISRAHYWPFEDFDSKPKLLRNFWQLTVKHPSPAHPSHAKRSSKHVV